jgi:cytochrome c553
MAEFLTPRERKMRKSNPVLALAMGTALTVGGGAYGADVATDTGSAAQKAALRKTVETCGTCHGVDGRSISPTFPNLAAQQAPYIELQLKAFKDQSRADPDAQAYMWGMASQLSDASVSALAAYFAAQPAAPGRGGNSALIAQGKRLFEEGVPTPRVWPYFRAWLGNMRPIY